MPPQAAPSSYHPLFNLRTNYQDAPLLTVSSTSAKTLSIGHGHL